jgi:MtrB/PioB family decaheme-associated outer membrane protein
MRNTLVIVATTLLLAAASAQAQQRVASGFVDLSVSTADVTGDAARFQRYVDRRPKGSVEGFRLDAAGEGWRFESRALHLGRRDQWLSAALRTPKVKASFSWDQIPYFTSAVTRSPFYVESPGVLRLDDLMQAGVEAGQLRLTDVASTARGFEMRSRRHTARFDFQYSPTRFVDLRVGFKETHRDGDESIHGAFGFNNVVELSSPIDLRTRDLNADVEWTGARGLLRFGYDGSWFTNKVPTLVWDNPLKLSDIVASNGYVTGLAGSQGRMALWPDSTMHGLSTSGYLKLPAGTRVTAHVRTGMQRQNQPLLPVTINSAAPDLPLPRDTADVEARTLAVSVVATSRPVRYFSTDVRYRVFDFDNRTPVFATPFLVFDQALHDTVATAPTSYTRATLDLNASVMPVQSTNVRVGYSRGTDDRTFRIFERTTEDTYRASIDSGWRVVTVHGIVERSERRGTGFDVHQLEHAGEQPALRHYDVADRDRLRVTGLVQVMPHKTVAFSGSIATGEDEYANSGFGLRNNDNRSYSVTVDVAPVQRFSFTGSYTKEKFTASQASRSASPGPQVLDPTRDWAIDSADTVETVGASVEALKLIPRTDIRFAYDVSRSDAAYVYRAPANTTLAPFSQLPTVRNALREANGEVRFFLNKQVALGAIYWYSDYEVEDFARGLETVGRLTPTGSLFLGSIYQPYSATSAALRLMYIW